jgi:hypothetical protein
MQKRLSSLPSRANPATNRNTTSQKWLPPVDSKAPNLSAHAKKAAARKRQQQSDTV